jgi:hypothetical protein
VSANLPNIKSIGTLYKAMAPGNFTYGSHSAMFVGFTPGVAELRQSFVNPKFGKIFKLVGAGFPAKGTEWFTLKGKNIIDGFNRKGYVTVGTGAVGWFDPNTPTGQHLTSDFQKFFYPGSFSSLPLQLEWINDTLEKEDRPVFLFINIGETHVPYYYDDAPWDKSYNPCIPFSNDNDKEECIRRQKACLEYVDYTLAPLLKIFKNATIVICSDHGDCWGEDGLWEHGIHHEKTIEVPLIFQLNS